VQQQLLLPPWPLLPAASQVSPAPQVLAARRFLVELCLEVMGSQKTC
jgi:hypothetical protein